MTDNTAIAASVEAARIRNAAESLGGLRGVSICVDGISTDLVEQLAVEFDTTTSETVHLAFHPPAVIVAFSAVHSGVAIRVEGSRLPVAERDARLRGWNSESNRWATQDEVSAAVGAMR